VETNRDAESGEQVKADRKEHVGEPDAVPPQHRHRDGQPGERRHHDQPGHRHLRSPRTRPGGRGAVGERPGAVIADPFFLIYHNLCLSSWEGSQVTRCTGAGQRSDQTLMDVAPSPLGSWLKTAGEWVVGFLVVRPGMTAG
jgi:hypothetical protein